MEKPGTQRPIKVCGDCPQLLAVKRVTKRDYDGKCRVSGVKRNDFSRACGRPEWQDTPIPTVEEKIVAKKGNP